MGAGDIVLLSDLWLLWSAKWPQVGLAAGWGGVKDEGVRTMVRAIRASVSAPRNDYGVFAFDCRGKWGR